MENKEHKYFKKEHYIKYTKYTGRTWLETPPYIQMISPQLEKKFISDKKANKSTYSKTILKNSTEKYVKKK